MMYFDKLSKLITTVCKIFDLEKNLKTKTNK